MGSTPESGVRSRTGDRQDQSGSGLMVFAFSSGSDEENGVEAVVRTTSSQPFRFANS
ncbi:MAG: hypothetical protein LIP77_07835 [Planctomycetes bacterium]|nr:hypothetical protein [Planctomycetota bacterium]